MSHRIRILAVEPFFGGSHAAFLQGLSGASRHQITLLTLPARKWKWRMRTAPLAMAHMLDGISDNFDLMLASDFLDLATFRGLRPDRLRCLKTVVYFHENQITYPVRHKDERDCHFAVTNLLTLHAADAVWFNSHWHKTDFIDGAKRLVAKMPGPFRENWLAPLSGRIDVQPLGLDLSEIDRTRPNRSPGPLVILWNHRWEFDKCPEAFFDAISRLDDRRVDFRLAVCGKRFREWPSCFDEARGRFGHRMIHFGPCEERSAYVRLLRSCDIVVSTAKHEFFGVSVVEAIHAGCYPLLPARLSYPELLPPSRHDEFLYSDLNDLVERLVTLCNDPQRAGQNGLGSAMRRFDWSRRGPEFDAALEAVAAQPRRETSC